MISIRKYIVNNATEQSLVRVIQLLLKGIGLHAVEGDPEAYSQFRQNVEQVLAAVDDAGSNADLISHAADALKFLEAHNRETTAHWNAKSVELQSMVHMLSGTIGSISAAGDENVRRLEDIERQVETASQIEDVRQVKAKLGECLDQIRNEAERQRTETGRAVAELTRGLAGALPPETPAASIDPGSGLPNRQAAEETLAQACNEKAQAFAVSVTIDRIQTFNARFGYEVGDEILRYFAAFLKKQWGEKDLFFRWTDSTLIALIFRPNRLERVRDEIGRVMELKYEHTVQLPSRTVLLPISLRWAVFPMMNPPVLLVRNIDSVVNR